MNTRQQQIMKELIGESKPITGERLGSIIKVTPRTIRNDIKDLNHLLVNSGATVLSLRSQGYLLEIINQEDFNNFIFSSVEFVNNIPVEPEDRVQYLMKKVLLMSNYLKVEDLADELYVSRSTLKNDLRDVKVILKKYNLNLDHKAKYGLILTGSERNIRFAMSEMLFNRSNLIMEKNHQSWLLPQDSLEIINQTILEEISNFNFSLSDIALQNLAVHIAIACKRVKNQRYMEEREYNFEDLITKKEYSIAKEIIRNIEIKLHLQFPQVEILYVAMHLLGTRLLLNKGNSEILNSFDEKIVDTVNQLINQVEKQMNLGIKTDKELFTAIALHLKPAIHRFKNQMNVRNPILEAIKVNYPVAFEAAIKAGKIINESFEININEHEIGYIALHFGTAIEKRNLKKKPKRCLIVCTTGLGSSQLLLYKMMARFGNKLTFLGTTELHSLPNYRDDEVDFIVSTVPLPNTITIPHILINTLLGNSELSKIEQMMDEDFSIVDKYLKEDLIYTNIPCNTYEEVIKYLGEELIRKGITEDGMVETVLEREKVASTSYGNLVAIPHPLEAKAPNTFWTIATIKKPIDWGKNKVQFVCLLHVAKKNKEDLKPMYETLVRLVDDSVRIQKLINAKDRTSILKALKGI